MKGLWPVALLLVLVAGGVDAAEERIRGILENTANPGACAQITDALNDVYYVVKTVESEKACAPLIGQRVVLTGTVEERVDDRLLYLTLKKAEVYQSRQPETPADASTSTPIPSPAPVPPADEKKTDP